MFQIPRTRGIFHLPPELRPNDSTDRDDVIFESSLAHMGHGRMLRSGEHQTVDAEPSPRPLQSASRTRLSRKPSGHGWL